MRTIIKLLLEVGPLGVFFLSFNLFDIYVATGAFMVAILVSLGLSYALHRKLPRMAMVTAVVVMVFGGLTLALHDDTFIKLKPTIANSLFAFILFFGLLRGRSYMKLLMEEMLPLDDAGWRIFTYRWACFFVALAVLNEIVWRTQTTEFWVNFKTFGIMPLTLIFTFAQMPLLSRHAIAPKEVQPDDGEV